MTNLNDPFSQFKVPTFLTYSKPQKQDKSKENKNSLLAPLGTLIGGISGYTIAKIQEKDSFKKLENNKKLLEQDLIEQLDNSEAGKQLNTNIKAAQQGLNSAVESLKKYQKDLKNTQTQSQIDILEDLITIATNKKNENQSALEEYKKMITLLRENYVQKPLEQFVQQEKSAIKKHNIKTTSIAGIIGLIISISIILINKYITKKNEK